ncbi:MAG: galactosyldiacylglycerol synthase [Armatimonadota bacterium]|nr:galactosyldiacylglycerol synthase [Armatimonadota bacterium]MCS7193262.1 galactosyldiacylglycerol synthase [Armatimonadota bacterium]MDW8144606.1 galactosyldiacylglycerol synthase [Armatimonadota bacterium]
MEKQHKLICLYDLETGDCIGEINEEQLQALIEAFEFEEEHFEARDYYVHRATLTLIKDDQLVALLEKALGEREEMDIRWE